MEKNKPQQIRLGNTRLAIWKNRSEKDSEGFWFTWSVEKRFQRDGNWETTHTFRDADAPVVILLLTVATLRMVKELFASQNA